MKRTRLDGLPRMRGDRPVHYTKVLVILRFTPHARGSTAAETGNEKLEQVYPACAGIDPLPQAIRPGSVRLPRMRGDRPCRLGGAGCVLKFTPHARGSTLLARAHEEAEEVYPACAGIDLVLAVKTYTEEGLPRMRGDRPIPHSSSSFSTVFTPHARGSTRRCFVHVIFARVYPACAGIDRTRDL